MDAGTGVGVAVAAGFIVPIIISFLKDTNWSTKVKQLLSFVISSVIGLLITVYDGGISWDSVVQNIGLVFTTSQVWYTQIFEGTTVNAVLERTGIGKK